MNRLHTLAVLAGMALAIAAAVPAIAAADELPFGLEPGSFSTELSTNQAGAHPDLRTRFAFNRNDQGSSAGGAVKDLNIVLPKGLLGNPNATPICPLSVAVLLGSPCPTNAAVGHGFVQVAQAGAGVFNEKVLIFNVKPYPGEPAAFAFNAILPVRIDTHVRADGDYGVTVSSTDLTEAAADVNTDITLWGVPADHNGPGPSETNFGVSFGGPSGAPRVPLLTNPSECSGEPLSSSFSADNWLAPGKFTTPVNYSLGPISGCEEPEFTPTISAQPTTNLADAPSGLDFKLHLPQHEGPFAGANEVQQLNLITSGGQFRFGFGADRTGATGTGDLTESSTTVANVAPSATGAFIPGETILGAGIAPETTIVAVGAGTITLSQPATATGSSVSLSADLPYNASTGAMQRALEALPTIGTGNVSVTQGEGPAGFPVPRYSIAFEGDLGNTDVSQLTTEGGAEPLSGFALVSTLRDGIPGPAAEEIATSQLRDAVVTLPAGMSVNPSSANGLGACSLAQAGVSASGQSDGKAVNCPLASKLGTVEAISPAIDHPLGGSLYLAAQNENPFGSLLALYLVIEDLKSGINAKLSGKVEADPSTGQLTVSFRDNPQLPVEDLNISLFKGDRAALKTPSACGVHTTTSVLTPWTAPAGANATPSSSFSLTNGPSGGACLPDGAGAPNKPTFKAGTLNPTAKAFSPFVLKLTREDGSQAFKAIDATLPKGLLGKLAGIPYCSDSALAAAASKSGKAEQASSSCPAASQVGSVDVGAGAGPDPFSATGKAYLAGPYKGAPLSLAIVTPAVAGPFDLGTVVVRNALRIDPETAQVHAVSDPIPTILQGIPLDIRSITVSLDKPNFTLNPTNCAPTSVLGGVTSVFNQAASLSAPFQVGDCGRLPFKPSLSINLKGGTSRSDHPALTAVLKARPNDSNIAAATVALPHSEFLAQNHIRTVCTRVQFAAGAGNGAECPAGSIYGSAKAISPLVDQPLSGPVYLRSSSNPLPDLVVALHGQIDVDLVGRIDSVNGGIRTTFSSVPDAPVSKFVLSMQGGKKGLLENSRNLCKSNNKATVRFDGQNDKPYDINPVLGNSCKKAEKHAKGKGKKKAHR